MQLIELLIKIETQSNLDKINQLVYQYYQESQYVIFQNKFRRDYNKQYPVMDLKGKPIEYTDQKYKLDDDGNIAKDKDDNPIPNDNYKPSFEEWMQNQITEWNTTHPNDTDDNPYQFKFDPASVTIDTNIKTALKTYNKNLFVHYTQNYYIYSNVLNANVDVGDKHLRNVEKLITYMESNSVSDTQFRTHDNSFITTTLDQLKQLDDELIQYGIQMYQKKWSNEQLIDNIESFDDLTNLKIDYSLS